MSYSVIMDDNYGDVRIFYINYYDEKIWKSISHLFKRHTILAVVPRSGGYVNSRGGWRMNEEDLIDQIYLSEFYFDESEDWIQYKKDMKSFIKEYVVQ